ncbi:hypothetical protein [Thalassotalea fusca]
MSQWKVFCDRFLNITPREQYLIIGSGIMLIFFSFYNLYLDNALTQVDSVEQKVKQIRSTNLAALKTIDVLEEALETDPNASVEKQITRKQRKLATIDQRLLTLTTELINPTQMRAALIDLLALQKGVSLVSLEVLPAQPLTTKTSQGEQNSQSSANTPTTNTPTTKVSKNNEVAGMVLYKHSMRLTLSGGYFQLRDYLAQVETLDWTFFWQSFDYQLMEYPKSQLVIEIYSLSTNKEFIGV